MLSLEDLNLVIKHFATNICHRIEQYEHSQRTHKTIRKPDAGPDQHKKQQQHQQSADIEQILARYSGYAAKSDRDKQYIRKAVERVQQIFGFYKWRSRSTNTLNFVERQFGHKLAALLSEPAPNIGNILAYMIETCHRQICFSSVAKTPAMEAQRIRNKLYSRSETKQVRQFRTSTQMGHACSHVSTEVLKNKGRAQSVMSLPTREGMLEVIDKFYACLGIDKTHLIRMIETESLQKKKELRRNKSAFKKVQATELKRDRNASVMSKRLKTEPTVEQSGALKQIRTNVKVLGMAVNNFDEIKIKKAPVMSLGIFGKKWSKVKAVCKKRNYLTNNRDENVYI